MKNIVRTPELKLALEQSLKHWQENQGLLKNNARFWGDSCPMCRLVSDNCSLCVLEDLTQLSLSKDAQCCSGLWLAARDCNPVDWPLAAKAVADFIESKLNELFPKGKTMKARVIGEIVDGWQYVGKSDKPELTERIIEAKSIEVIPETKQPDPPKEREIKTGDVLVKDTSGCIVAVNGFGDQPVTYLNPRDQNNPNYTQLPALFNLLDLISEMKKAKEAGRTEKFKGHNHDDILAKKGSSGEIDVWVNCSSGTKVIALHTPDARQFAMGILGLCLEGDK